MSGTIPLSMTQQFDVYGKPLSGGQLYIIQAGTVSTPQDAFQDIALTIKQPYPMTLDAAGRIPQFFLADGTVKIRLQDRAGVVQLAADAVLVIGPSAGGGGGASVDPTALIQTGNMILRYGTGGIAGYVRGNALTIGSFASAASERANADTQALFLHLWAADPTLVLIPPRGASASADWGLNKKLTLPDWRGFAIGALDDMGNVPSTRLSNYGAVVPITLGGQLGTQTYSLATANMVNHTHGGTTNTIVNTTYPNAVSHNHSVSGGTVAGVTAAGAQVGGAFFAVAANVAAGNGIVIDARNTDHAHGFTTAGVTAMTAAAFGIVGPRKLCTVYLKL